MRAARELSRRAMLAASVGAAIAFGANKLPAASRSKRQEYDPRRSAEGQVKLTATLDESPAFWSYSGIIYAVRAGLRPVAVLAVAGCQTQWAQRQSDASYRLEASLLTFFRDPSSGAFIDHFDNPITGQTNPVEANVFAGGGYALYPADGSAMRIGGQIRASQSAPQGFAAADSSKPIGRAEWTLTADSVVLNTDQAFDVRVQPQLEAQTRTADRTKFFEPRTRRLPARFSATTISPWLAWMDMAGAEGHLVWHTSGEKLFDAGLLPADYRAQAGARLAQLLTRPAS